MRIILIHRHFWPDTPPYASMLLTIARQLVVDGHNVQVFTSIPSYKSDANTLSKNLTDSINDIKIKRIFLFQENGRSIFFKLLNMVYFPIRILFHILMNPKVDVVMSSTAPPVITGFCSALGAKIIKAKFIYHCMDIHPEVGRISGEFRNTLLYAFLLKLDHWACKNAKHIIVLSEDMKRSLLMRDNRDNLQRKIQIINNFSLSGYEENDGKVNSQFLKGKDKFRILFAGNIGRFQKLESFIDAMHILSKGNVNIELVFLGEGAALDSLMERAKDKLGKTIHFFPHQKISVARKIMADADLGIVSLLPEVYKYALPSKTMTYLDEGCPILVTVEEESELVKFIIDQEVGIFSRLGDAESIAATVNQFIKETTNTSSSKSLSARCKYVADKYFSERTIVQKWSSLYEKLER